MITDRQLTFSNGQAVTTGTQLSTDNYDMGVAGINLNTGFELQIFAAVTTAFVGGTSLEVQVIQSAASDMSSPTVLATSGAIPVASLTRGAVLLRSALPRTSQRFIGVRYVSAGTFTAGNTFAGIVEDTDDTVIPAFETGR